MPDDDRDQQPDEQDEWTQGQGRWEMGRGPVTKIITWLILIVFAITVLGMIVVVLFDL